MLGFGQLKKKTNLKVYYEEVVHLKKIRDTLIVTTVSRHQLLQGLIVFS